MCVLYSGYMSVFSYLRHLFVPHTTNNHRSKILHTDALLGYVFLFAVFNFVLKGTQNALPDVLGYATDINVQQLLANTNAERAQAGLQPLTLNQQLSVALS